MVVDYKKFVPNAPELGAGLLFVLEQMPLVTSFSFIIIIMIIISLFIIFVHII